MEPITYTFNPWNYTDFSRKNGHIQIDVNVFPSDGIPTKIPVVFDTGAYITVLTRMSARRIGLPLTGKYTANLTGFNKERGSDEAEIVIVPKVVIGKFMMEDVQILVPLEDIEVAEVIGENVLEYFNYTVDHSSDRIYFAKNPAPKPYINHAKGIDLSCGRVLAQEY